MVYFKPHTPWKHTSQADALTPKYTSAVKVPHKVIFVIRSVRGHLRTQSMCVQTNFMCTDHV